VVFYHARGLERYPAEHCLLRFFHQAVNCKHVLLRRRLLANAVTGEQRQSPVKSNALPMASAKSIPQGNLPSGTLCCARLIVLLGLPAAGCCGWVAAAVAPAAAAAAVPAAMCCATSKAIYYVFVQHGRCGYS
jgi:hypothetical protein